MALEQLEMTTGLNKVDFAIKLLRDYEPDEGYYLAFSGGKDSCVLYDIALKAGVKFDAHYNVSPIDPPPLFKFIRENYHDVQWDYHAKGFWKLVRQKGLPLRRKRWCCDLIKESGGSNRIIVAGMRSSESKKRSKYNYVQSRIKSKTNKYVYVCPILSFTEYDIWQYIRLNNLSYCSLYDEGFKRLGCVLCPYSSDPQKEAARFPEIARLWKRACDYIVQDTIERGNVDKRGNPIRNKFNSGQEMFDWWISRK
jgi:phosphoadenosine phosphosulfate reductase